ncbi:MAG: hypothetical protein A2V66_13660 [Ignavibacteria bacterium RBG_13_36_8]|nr:MAG: hypothetical protein A2V66_13660 [Ignavibacteria bacterium RBG_13_36_8]
MFQKIKRNLLLSLAIAALVYLALTIFGDFNSVISSFKEFNWLLLPLLLFLSYLNYFTRFLKWNYYIKLLCIKIQKKDSFGIFMSGLIMSITPGKMGELIKAYLVKQISEEPISRTAPIILVERLTDFLALILLSLIGAFIFNYGKILVISLLLFFLLMVFIISSPKIASQIIGYLSSTKILKKYFDKMNNAYRSSYLMLRPLPLVYMILLSVVAWFFECFGFYLILLNFSIDFPLFLAIFIYSFSTIVGAVSMLPGGLGITEGSLTFLMIEHNIAKDIAIASTFIVRVVTLWFAVLIGILSVMFYKRRYGSIAFD